MEENWIKVLMELEAIEEKLKLQEDKNEHKENKENKENENDER